MRHAPAACRAWPHARVARRLLRKTRAASSTAARHVSRRCCAGCTRAALRPTRSISARPLAASCAHESRPTCRARRRRSDARHVAARRLAEDREQPVFVDLRFTQRRGPPQQACGDASVHAPASVVSVMLNSRLIRPSSAAAISLCTRSDTGVSASTIAHSRIDDSAGPTGSTDHGAHACSAAASTSSAAKLACTEHTTSACTGALVSRSQSRDGDEARDDRQVRIEAVEQATAAMTRRGAQHAAPFVGQQRMLDHDIDPSSSSRHAKRGPVGTARRAADRDARDPHVLGQ